MRGRKLRQETRRRASRVPRKQFSLWGPSQAFGEATLTLAGSRRPPRLLVYSCEQTNLSELLQQSVQGRTRLFTLAGFLRLPKTSWFLFPSARRGSFRLLPHAHAPAHAPALFVAPPLGPSQAFNFCCFPSARIARRASRDSTRRRSSPHPSAIEPCASASKNAVCVVDRYCHRARCLGRGRDSGCSHRRVLVRGRSDADRPATYRLETQGALVGHERERPGRPDVRLCHCRVRVSGSDSNPRPSARPRRPWRGLLAEESAVALAPVLGRLQNRKSATS